MQSPPVPKVEKLVVKIHQLLSNIPEFGGDLVVRRCIDRYYYLQKVEELHLLNEAVRKLRVSQEQLMQYYREVYFRWSNDVRWLNRHLIFDEPCPQSLSL